MAKRRKRSLRGLLSGKHAFTKEVLTTLAGATVGVVANKAMNDAFTVGGWNPSVLTPLVVSDVAVLGAEIGGAFYAKKRRKYKASKFLISMASGSVAADIFQVAGNANWWGVLGAPSAMRFSNGFNGSRAGRYGNSAPQNGKIGGFMTPIHYTYPRR